MWWNNLPSSFIWLRSSAASKSTISLIKTCTKGFCRVFYKQAKRKSISLIRSPLSLFSVFLKHNRPAAFTEHLFSPLLLLSWHSIFHSVYQDREMLAMKMSEPCEYELVFLGVKRRCLLSLHEALESHGKIMNNLCYSKSAVHFTCVCLSPVNTARA